MALSFRPATREGLSARPSLEHPGRHWPEITPATRPAIVQMNGTRLGVLICLEDLDRTYAAEVARLGPELLVSIASDTWFGNGAAAEQHLALASFRAIKQRRDLGRGTTTGISAVIDAIGRVSAESDYVPVPPGQNRSPVSVFGKASALQIPAMGSWGLRVFPLLCSSTLLTLAWRVRKKAFTRSVTVAGYFRG